MNRYPFRNPKPLEVFQVRHNPKVSYFKIYHEDKDLSEQCRL